MKNTHNTIIAYFIARFVEGRSMTRLSAENQELKKENKKLKEENKDLKKLNDLIAAAATKILIRPQPDNIVWVKNEYDISPSRTGGRDV